MKLSNINMYVTLNCMILLKLQILVYNFHYNKGIQYNIIAKYFEKNQQKLITYLLN
jgi:hypothetical protein